MKIIEKIEILNFRSFLWTKSDDKAEIVDIVDLSIFSGANDSGKSNILRALNLFFNDKIDTVHEFNFSNDFNVLKNEFTQKVISIKIHFLINKRRFSITKFYDRNGYRNFEYRFIENNEEIIIDERVEKNKERYSWSTEILKKENGYRRNAIRFISSISFSYVPAIREERFFTHLYWKIITQIKQNEERQIEELESERRKIERWERTIKNTSEKTIFIENIQKEFWRIERLKEISNEIEKISNIETAITGLEKQINDFSGSLFSSVNFLSSEFKVWSNLRDFFESFDIWTGTDKSISLRLRWDWLQAKFIPEMLNFLDSISTKRYFIWWFEEPENSAEYKNQQELAKKLKNDFLKNKQIFLTTHSEEFLSLYDWNEIDLLKRKANLYHVRKISNSDFQDFSTIQLFNVEKRVFDSLNTVSDIQNDLWTSIIRAKYSKELKEREEIFLRDKQDIENKHQELQRVITQLTKPIVFVEDDYTDTYKISWLKLNNIPIDSIDELEEIFIKHSPFYIISKNWRWPLKGILNTPTIEEFIGKKIIWVFDFDEAYEDFDSLKNAWWGVLWSEETCLYKTRDDHPCFHSILIPVPTSRSCIAKKDFGKRSSLEMEYLFEDCDLKNLFTNPEYKAVPWGQLIQTWQKQLFPGRVFSLPKESYWNFLPLFNKIHELFWISLIWNS